MAWLICLVVIVLVLGLAARGAARPRRHTRATSDVAQSIPTLVVGDLVVRRAAPADVVTIVETMDQSFMEANGWNQAIADASAAQLRTVDPAQLGYVVVCDGDGSMLGYGVISRVTWSRSRCSLGFALHPSRRSQGLGPAALAAVFEAVHRAGVKEIVIGTRETNRAMASCIERAGGIEAMHRAPIHLPDGSRPQSVWFTHR